MKHEPVFELYACRYWHPPSWVREEMPILQL